MNHDDIGTSIQELYRKVDSIRTEMLKIADLIVTYNNERFDLERYRRGMEAMEQNMPTLRSELADVYDALGRAYQRKDDEYTAKFYFDKAKDERVKIRRRT